jgi:hypothetical protein
MPMRRISTSLPRVGFADDASPLTEGLANAASTLGELWPRLRQIDAEQQRDQQYKNERDADRRQGRQERSDAAEERHRLWDTNRADTQAANAHHDQLWAAQNGAYTGSDPALSTVSGNVEQSRRHSQDLEAAKLGMYQGEDQGMLDLSQRSREAGLRPPLHTKDPSTGWQLDKDSGQHFRTNSKGEIEVYDPVTKKRTIVNGNAPADEPVTTAPVPVDDSQASTFRRSGRPGVHSVGDAVGGIVDLWGHAPWSNVPSDDAPVDQGTAPTVTQQQPTEPQVDDTYVATMHSLGQTDPKKFTDSMLALKVKDPRGYAATAKRLRELDAAQPGVAGAQ